MTTTDTNAALVGIISNLAKQYDPSRDNTFRSHVLTNGGRSTKIQLPGIDSPGKEALETELQALADRIQYLEAKAQANSSVNDNTVFPLTPAAEPILQNAFSASAKPDLEDLPPPLPLTPRTIRAASNAFKDQRALWVSSWLAARESEGDSPGSITPLTDEQLNYLRDHLNKQAEQIKSQREHIDQLSNEVNKQLREQEIAFEHGIEDVGQLKRELGKHQQANVAFQKALREIGSIVTAVAKGDLSKKVLIHAKEMDPEIATFKRTINRMVDQLQDFASQVTHLAREVGTEGRLGGQANLPGVDGIWAELTDSGMYLPPPCFILKMILSVFSQCNGKEPHRSSA
jgi:osomolarity two-component system, sensor histidine kinase NIK1